jgi:circadian clock protein KaiB
LSSNGEAVSDPGVYRLRLFVAGNTFRSLRAIDNLRRVCDVYLMGRHDLEVIDIYQQPELVERYGILAAPTLLKLMPLPERRISGDLSEMDKILRGLDLAPSPALDGHDV